jgi:hypothetical protein
MANTSKVPLVMSNASSSRPVAAARQPESGTPQITPVAEVLCNNCGGNNGFWNNLVAISLLSAAINTAPTAGVHSTTVPAPRRRASNSFLYAFDLLKKDGEEHDPSSSKRCGCAVAQTCAASL